MPKHHRTLASEIPDSIRCVIFDCDGVLIDSRESTRKFFNIILEDVGLGPLDQEQMEYCFIHTVEESLAHITPKPLFAQALQARKRLRVEEILPLIRRHDGIRRFIADLKDRGVRTAVDTNGGREQHAILEHVELRSLFDAIVTTEEVAQGKPSPEGVRAILAAFGLEPEQALFIGDSAIDMRAARNGGTLFWAFGNSELRADRHVASFLAE